MHSSLTLILVVVIAFLLGILFCLKLYVLYRILKWFIESNDRKALPLPRNKAILVENISALTSMSNSDLINLQLYLSQAQNRLDALIKYNEAEGSQLYALRNSKSERE
jgi:hypothetical protein